MADTEREAQGGLRVDDGRYQLQIYRRDRDCVFRSRFLCKESYPALDELIRREFETDYKRI